jgi:hypothetical protein
MNELKLNNGKSQDENSPWEPVTSLATGERSEMLIARLQLRTFASMETTAGSDEDAYFAALSLSFRRIRSRSRVIGLTRRFPAALLLLPYS